jgi:DNA anti-recombination protein RmuC
MEAEMAEQEGGTPAADGGGTPQNQELTFDGWIAQQDDAVRGLLDGHTSGLKTALQSEREQRSRLQSELKKVTRELEEGTDARKQLEGISARLEEVETQNAAYETLTAAGASNLRLAWMAAQSSGAIDKRGNIQLETLKAEFPELFKKNATPPPGNAGSGQTNGLPAGNASMDDIIRRRAGVIQ